MIIRKNSRSATILLALLWLLSTGSLWSAVREVGAIGLTVDRLENVLPFYTNVLGFEWMEEKPLDSVEWSRLTGLPGASVRRARLALGEEMITLTEWDSPKGRAIPHDSRSFDHWFQHIAIVVRDMDAAFEHLRQHRVRFVSTAPQTLPAWNVNAGGIKAFYFRDPEDHVLEIIWFPPGKGDPKWQRSSKQLFLGIDHTAIVVADTERSLGFYRDRLGMRVVGQSENYGIEQEHLNQVFGARLRITSLRGDRGPGIEFLEYLTPPGGRPLWPDAAPNDLVFWTSELFIDQWQSKPSDRILSRGELEDFLLRDPDGHALILHRDHS